MLKSQPSPANSEARYAPQRARAALLEKANNEACFGLVLVRSRKMLHTNGWLEMAVMDSNMDSQFTCAAKEERPFAWDLLLSLSGSNGCRTVHWYSTP